MTHLLLKSDTGHFLKEDDDGLSYCSYADDHATWSMDGRKLVNCATGYSLSCTPSADGRLLVTGKEGWSESLAKLIAPEKLPSEHLAELQDKGFTVVNNIVPRDVLPHIRAATREQIAAMDPTPALFDDRFGVPNCNAWSADCCRAVTHPIALWLIQRYLDTPDIHFCHQPVMTVMRPARDLVGQFPEEGWHSDYPYHPDVYPEDRWHDPDIYGVQYNICIDEFRADNGATQFVPTSHTREMFPPQAMNTGGTRMGIAPHDEVQQMTAPAGAALIYDSRTWHRACAELNTSSDDRIAILNAVCPNWVRHMADMRAGLQAFKASGMDGLLSERDSEMIDLMCHQPRAKVPEGVPYIAAKQRRYQL
jgi:hypothetical protein